MSRVCLPKWHLDHVLEWELFLDLNAWIFNSLGWTVSESGKRNTIWQICSRQGWKHLVKIMVFKSSLQQRRKKVTVCRKVFTWNYNSVNTSLSHLVHKEYPDQLVVLCRWMRVLENSLIYPLNKVILIIIKYKVSEFQLLYCDFINYKSFHILV